MRDSIKLDNSTQGSTNDNPHVRTRTPPQQSRNTACNWLGHVKRAYILLSAFAAIAFSIVVVYSCAFFSYRSLDGQPWESLMPPFDSLASASVGLFSYSVTVPSKGIELSFLTEGGCVAYDNPWKTGQNLYWIIAQWCAVIAPAAGFLAWIQLIFEMIFCRLRCSFVLILLLFFAASGLQGCSFMILADREFW
jgi:hypothetical protein